MPKPDRYPLPWCDRLDVAYWQINFHGSAATYGLERGWCRWQAHRPMSQIIPVLDWLLDHGGLHSATGPRVSVDSRK